MHAAAPLLNGHVFGDHNGVRTGPDKLAAAFPAWFIKYAPLAEGTAFTVDGAAKADAEKTALENQTNYYAKWRLAYVCDSIVADFLFGDDSVTSGMADEASKAKKECLALGSEGSTKGILSSESYANVSKRFVSVFGKEPE